MNGYKRSIHPDTKITILYASVLVVFVICLIGKTIVSCNKQIEVATTSQPSTENYISEEDIQLIALTTCGEAEGESEYGKRLVIDTILNRVDSPYFPNTIRDVIYQRRAFECMWTDRLEKSYVDDDICDLVREELIDRTDDRVIFFQQGCYSEYGDPLYKVGNHYFSEYRQERIH